MQKLSTAGCDEGSVAPTGSGAGPARDGADGPETACHEIVYPPDPAAPSRRAKAAHDGRVRAWYRWAGHRLQSFAPAPGAGHENPATPARAIAQAHSTWTGWCVHHRPTGRANPHRSSAFHTRGPAPRRWWLVRDATPPAPNAVPPPPEAVPPPGNP